MNDMPDNTDFIDLIRLLIPIRPMISREALGIGVSA